VIPRLSPDSVRDTPNPNFSPRPDGISIDMLILHTTGSTDASRSTHYVVERDGIIRRLVDEAARAFHAGDGVWRGNRNLDDRSIGIEIACSALGARHYPALQMASVCELCLSVLARHPIPARNVVGHGDVMPDKQDFGDPFDWPGLAKNGVGLWPDVPDDGDGDEEAGDAARIRADLVAIGYGFGDDGATLVDVLRAAQRHWRPELVTGLADAGTVGRLAALRAMIDTGY